MAEILDTSLGYQSKAADKSVAIGYKTEACGVGSVVIGAGITCTSPNSFIIGYTPTNGTATSYKLFDFATGKLSNTIFPIASTTTFGAVKVGSGLSIDENGVLDSGLDISKGIVIGEGATATCTTTGETFVDNIAIGTGAVATQEGGIAIGCAIASGWNNTAIGPSVCADGDAASAFGNGANATNVKSIALGNCAIAAGEYSTSLGGCSIASEYHSMALGTGATSRGSHSTAIGDEATTTGFGALAMGTCAKAGENEIVLRSESAYCSTTQSRTCNVLKVSSTGILTLNGKEVGGGGGLDISKGIVIGEGATATCVCGEETTVFVDNVAIGTGAIANQEGAIAIGCSIANGIASVAMGYCASATGCYSTAFGACSCALWCYSTAIGSGTCAYSSGSTALGSSAQASGMDSTAVGHVACASGIYSTALGDSAYATGEYSTALGSSACAKGYGAVAIGYYARAEDNEIVLRSEGGYCATTQSLYCNVLKVSSAGVLTLNGKKVGCLDTSYGIVIGGGACAGGNSSNIAIGSYASTLGLYSTVLGADACAWACYSTAVGYNACVSCNYSTALGACARASGCSSTALGHCARASGNYSIALGDCARASGYGALAMGYCASAGENEIVLRSTNSSSTACNVLKVSSAGVLTLNNEEIKPTCVVTDLRAIVASATTVDTTEDDFTIDQVADALNNLINLLKGTVTTTTE